MKTINEYLNMIETKTGSDYAIAKKIGVSKQAISIIRKTGHVKEETAIKIADVLEIDRSEVVLAAMIARSEGEVKKTWENISKLSGIAATVLITCISVGNARNISDSSREHTIHYAKFLNGINLANVSFNTKINMRRGHVVIFKAAV